MDGVALVVGVGPPPRAVHELVTHHDVAGSDLRIKHVQIEGSVGVGLAARLVWRNYRLVAAIGDSAGAAPSLCDPSSHRPYSTGSCGCILCTAHRDSVANTVSVHWLLNQGFASG